MSLFARSEKAKLVDNVPAKIQLDLSTDESDDGQKYDMLEHMGLEEAEEASEPE